MVPIAGAPPLTPSTIQIRSGEVEALPWISNCCVWFVFAGLQSAGVLTDAADAYCGESAVNMVSIALRAENLRSLVRVRSAFFEIRIRMNSKIFKMRSLCSWFAIREGLDALKSEFDAHWCVKQSISAAICVGDIIMRLIKESRVNTRRFWGESNWFLQ